MANDYYQDSGAPATGASLTSAEIRAESASVELGFDKMPALTGNGGKIVAVNSAATGLESVAVTGTGNVVRATSPTLVTPALGTPSALVGTNITGTAAGLSIGGNAATATTASTVTTNANLTGGVTSVGNAATVVTNANLTGHVTSVGNAAVLGSFTVAQLNTAISDADVAVTSGFTATGDIIMSGASVFDANASIAAHATTMDPWSLGNYVTATGIAVTFTGMAAAPQAGAEVEIFMNAAHVFTHGAVFEVDGAVNYTAAIGDRVLIRAKSTTVFTVHPRKKDGTAVVSAGSFVKRKYGTPYATYASLATVIPVDDTIPQNTEGTEFVGDCTITPSNTANRLRITAIVPYVFSEEHVTLAIFQDATAGALAASTQRINVVATSQNRIITHEMAAGTVSATTFKLRIGVSAGTSYINGNATTRLLGGSQKIEMWVEEVTP